MRYFIGMTMLLLVTSPLCAETYLWIDGSGTYNFTDDLSTVPKKFRTSVKRRGDMADEPAAAPSTVPPKKNATEKQTSTPAAASDENTQLYNGKTYAAWRTEMATQAAELKKLEQQLDQMKQQLARPQGFSHEQNATLKSQYDDIRSKYDQKYRTYSELVETIRKAGLPIETGP